MLYAHCDHSKAMLTLGFWASAGWSSQVRYPPYEAWPCVEEGCAASQVTRVCLRSRRPRIRAGPELTDPLVTRYPESECIDVAYMLAILSSPYIIRRLNMILHPHQNRQLLASVRVAEKRSACNPTLSDGIPRPPPFSLLPSRRFPSAFCVSPYLSVYFEIRLRTFFFLGSWASSCAFRNDILLLLALRSSALLLTSGRAGRAVRWCAGGGNHGRSQWRAL